MNIVSIYFCEQISFFSSLGSFLDCWIDSMLWLILTFLNGAIILFHVIVFNIKRYTFDEKVSYLIISPLEVVWHSAYSIVSNLHIDCDISITAENHPESPTNPDVDEKTTDEFSWQEICILSVSVALIVIGVTGLIINYMQK